jgi:hypothetical protein
VDVGTDVGTVFGPLDPPYQSTGPAGGASEVLGDGIRIVLTAHVRRVIFDSHSIALRSRDRVLDDFKAIHGRDTGRSRC